MEVDTIMSLLGNIELQGDSLDINFSCKKSGQVKSEGIPKTLLLLSVE